MSNFPSLFPGVLILIMMMMMMWVAAWRVDAASNNITGAPAPDCSQSHRCGDVSIPYPFGISKGCRKEGFGITCDTSHSPHRPFIGGDTQLELIDVNLNLGQARVHNHVNRMCSNEIGAVNSSMAMDLTRQPVYRLSTRNMFTAVGCSGLAFAYDESKPSYVSVCASICLSDLASVTNGTCFGSGCCKLPIPEGLRNFSTILTKMPDDNTSDASQHKLTCNYAFVVDEDWYNFTTTDLVGDSFWRRNERGVPVVLEWSVGNVTCEEAKRDLTSYACASEKSECFDLFNGAGYICNCSKGYEGNPYVPGGCQNINECDRPKEYPCYGVCTDSQGNYTCSCPKGTSGNPSEKDGCTVKEKTFPLSLKVLIGTLSSLFFLTATSFWLYLGLEKRKLIRAKHNFFEQNGGLILKQQMTSKTRNNNYFKIFTQDELEKATNKFDKTLIIGRGGHGTVYRGVLEDNRTVAIKKSKIMEASQTKEFAKEMLILSQINHKNVIKLLGCCLEVEVPMLAYEFISNGNLYHYLHGREWDHSFSIPLDARLRIAQESAEALAYLHSYASPPIIHGDVKCSNILLDEQFTAKVSDFGASKLAPKDEVQFATVVQGTCGYLDPEYLVTCQLTEKSDVYSFGVVVLELLTRRKPLEFDASGKEKSLVSMFDSAMKLGNFAEILDREIASEENMGLVMELVQLAMHCLNIAGDKRPTMKEVADSLHKLRRSGRQQVTGRFDQQGTAFVYRNDWGMEQAMTESMDHASIAGVNSDDTTEVKSLLHVNLER